MLGLMLQSVIVAGIATLAAFLFERALRNMGMAGRHAWTLSLLSSAVLPFIPKLSSQHPIAVAVPFTLPALTIQAPSTARESNYAMMVWVGLAIVVALVWLTAYVRLRLARRTWNEQRMHDLDVFVSSDIGPAVFGFVRPRVVVPAWVRTTSNEEQRLILLHEREHIRAGDHLLLLFTILVTAWMPWNPFVWLQARRLRFAMEADCDQRVLAAAPDRARYASLLVDVGSRQAGLLLPAALAEHQNGLERRIGMIAEKLIRNRKKAALLFAGGIVAVVIACESRSPAEAVAGKQEARVVHDLVRSKMPGVPAGPGDTIHELRLTQTMKSQMKVSTTEPGFTPYTVKPDLANRDEIARQMERNYPALLRDAGVGGTTLAWVLVDDDGKVLATKVAKTSTHEALDQAALRVASKMKFTPGRKGDVNVPVWIQVPMVFKTQ